MSDFDPLLANLTAENLALRSVLTGLFIEMIRRGHTGIVSNAFAYSSAPLAGMTQKTPPSREVQEKARQILGELREELLGFSDGDPRVPRAGAAPSASQRAAD